MAAPSLFTIGHSTRELREFIDLLREHEIEQVVDVRKLPGSAKYPHFNADTLATALSKTGVELQRLDALTGRRPVSTTVPFEVNGWWKNRSFHNYADHALGAEFHEALGTLIEKGSTRVTVVMCAEAVWWRCHRRIIADHLLAAGEKVTHVLGPGQTKEAESSSGLMLNSEGKVTYPANAATEGS